MGLCAERYNASAFLLIDFGADVNHKDHEGLSPMYWAGACGNEPLMRYMLDHGGNPNITSHEKSGSYTPLHIAMFHERGDIVRLLVERGANLNARDRYRRRPIDCVGDRRDRDILEFVREAMRAKGLEVEDWESEDSGIDDLE
jgi:ankyrin repeat protein